MSRFLGLTIIAMVVSLIMACLYEETRAFPDEADKAEVKKAWIAIWATLELLIVGILLVIA